MRIFGHHTGEWFVLTVENFGIGVLPQEIESRALFEEGYQGILTRGEFRPGGGKGLSFAARVIRDHGGRIDVESIPMNRYRMSRLKQREAAKDADDGDRDVGNEPYLNRFSIYLPVSPSGKVNEQNGNGERTNNQDNILD